MLLMVGGCRMCERGRVGVKITFVNAVTGRWIAKELRFQLEVGMDTSLFTRAASSSSWCKPGS